MPRSEKKKMQSCKNAIMHFGGIAPLPLSRHHRFPLHDIATLLSRTSALCKYCHFSGQE